MSICSICAWECKKEELEECPFFDKNKDIPVLGTVTSDGFRLSHSFGGIEVEGIDDEGRTISTPTFTRNISIDTRRYEEWQRLVERDRERQRRERYRIERTAPHLRIHPRDHVHLLRHTDELESRWYRHEPTGVNEIVETFRGLDVVIDGSLSEGTAVIVCGDVTITFNRHSNQSWVDAINNQILALQHQWGYTPEEYRHFSIGGEISEEILNNFRDAIQNQTLRIPGHISTNGILEITDEDIEELERMFVHSNSQEDLNTTNTDSSAEEVQV